MKQKLFFIATLFMIVARSYHEIDDVKSKNEIPNSISKEEARQKVTTRSNNFRYNLKTAAIWN